MVLTGRVDSKINITNFQKLLHWSLLRCLYFVEKKASQGYEPGNADSGPPDLLGKKKLNVNLNFTTDYSKIPPVDDSKKHEKYVKLNVINKINSQKLNCKQ